MFDILAIVTPIFVAMGLGYLSIRWGLFTKADMRVLGKFVINFALPALVFNALTQRRIEEVLHTGYILIYAAGSMAVLLIGYVHARRMQKQSPSRSSFVAMGMSCSNSGFIGYPLALQFLGPVAAVGLALCMLVENLLILPLLMFLAERENAKGNGFRSLLRTLAGLFKSPLLISICLGFACALLHLRLPDALARVVGMFSGASTALSLFVIGGSLVGLQVRGLLSRVSPVVLGKLVLHPLCVWAAMLALASLAPSDPQLRMAAIVFSAVPMLGIYPILAQKHGHEGFCAAAQLATTVVSFVTLSIVLWLLKNFPV